jgi:hypothetical protein
MDQKTMVETHLTKEMVDIGAAFVRKLDEHGLRPDAALWLYFPEEQQWKLIIAEGKVGTEGPKKVYQKMQQILADFPDDISGLSLDDVALSRPDAPTIALLRVAIRTGPGISGIRFKNNVINGTLVEDAYIYRLN